MSPLLLAVLSRSRRSVVSDINDGMNEIWQAIVQELSIQVPSIDSFVRVTIRLVVALVLSALIGLEREAGGKAAGLRTHMLVGLGSALFIVVLSEAGASAGDLTRIVQGVAAGIGFIGGGVILKLEGERRVKGLTTAASIWLTSAVGIAAGAGKSGAAIVGIILSLWVLSSVHRWEQRREPRKPDSEEKRDVDELNSDEFNSDEDRISD
jgi:putative Mg2+ transporter-C (MgtC) family protein